MLMLIVKALYKVFVLADAKLLHCYLVHCGLVSTNGEVLNILIMINCDEYLRGIIFVYLLWKLALTK